MGLLIYYLKYHEQAYAPSDKTVNLVKTNTSNDRYNDDDGNTNVENLNPNSLTLESDLQRGMKTKLKDRRSLMKKQASNRRRRRSSARFLRINPDDDDDGGEGGHYDGTSSTSLGEVYRNAIRMNAENRINASNSWNLNLIDHLDRFIAPELRSSSGGGNGGRRLQGMNGGFSDNVTKNSYSAMESSMDSTMISGVNFTKASCTLDASVKIYSYRVDDVHLTSYKVLANLNRTDTNAGSNDKKKTSGTGFDGSNNEGRGGDGSASSPRPARSRGNSNAVDTLEQNAANINIHKLDAAFDIDPLFHKMSKTFDEGGAKGLLLANLGVGNSGCNIVFDSTLDTEDFVTEIKENVGDNFSLQKATVDVTILIDKLGSQLSDGSGSSISLEEVSLVPQLGSLRDQYTELGMGGFIDEAGKLSDRYASSLEEENEADKSIHLEAIERSRASQTDLGRSLNSRGSLGTYGSAGDYDYDDVGFDYSRDDGDVFGELHDENNRFSSSSSSFEPARASISSSKNSNENHDQLSTTASSKFSRHTFSQASVLLDAIASGDIFTMQSGNNYEYFNNQALESLTSGNLWAGAEHWKKMPSGRRRKTGAGVVDGGSDSSSDALEKNKKAGFKKKKGVKEKTTKSALCLGSNLFVSISNPVHNLEAVLEKPQRRRGKNPMGPLQFTNTMRVKYGKVDNLLPTDAGLAIKELVTLFLRPRANLADTAKANLEAADTMAKSTKAVEFGGVETWRVHDDNSYGVDEVELGFDLADNDYRKSYDDPDNEFVVPDLEGVRKVDKIKIGYATIARKVDVKRLKRDLWAELEQAFDVTKQDAIVGGEKSQGNDSDDVSTTSIGAESNLDPQTCSDDGKGESNQDQTETTEVSASLSFQETVRDMQASQSQADVTLPFYFICILHLCNEKGLSLESSGLEDFVIHNS
eukprot:jgi/Psemu1/320778/estExt_fgenesh1_pm.C_8120001